MMNYFIRYVCLYFLVGFSFIITFFVFDCRSMVKIFVCGVKIIIWGVGLCKVLGSKLFLV